MNPFAAFIKALIDAFKNWKPTPVVALPSPKKQDEPGTEYRLPGSFTFKNLDLIKQSEGLRLTAYLPTRKDVWTIGYGHTKTVYRGMTITQAGAEHLLRGDLAWVKEGLDKYVKVPITQNQYDALTSFLYNVGVPQFRTSTLLRKLNAKDYQGAADQFPRWNKQEGDVLKGLTIRRNEERELFLKKT